MCGPLPTKAEHQEALNQWRREQLRADSLEKQVIELEAELKRREFAEQQRHQVAETIYQKEIANKAKHS